MAYKQEFLLPREKAFQSKFLIIAYLTLKQLLTPQKRRQHHRQTYEQFIASCFQK